MGLAAEKQKQSLLSRLMKRNIQDAQITGARKIIEQEKAFAKKEERLQDKMKPWKIFTKAANMITGLPVSSIADKFIEPIMRREGAGGDASTFDVSSKDRIFGLGEMWDAKKSSFKDYLKGRESLMPGIESFGKEFLGKGFLNQWALGDIGAAFNTPMPGMEWGSNFLKAIKPEYKNGGLVRKYQEGDEVEDAEVDTPEEHSFVSSHKGGTYTIGDTYRVKEGGTFKKWVWKKDPYTGIEFREKQSFPYYSVYKRMSDGNLRKVSSKNKSTTKMRGAKTKSFYEGMVNKYDLEKASTYLQEGKGLYKRDPAMAQLVKDAQGGNPTSLRQLALIAQAQRPDLQGKSMPEIIEAIKNQLTSVDINLEGEGYDELVTTKESKEATLAEGLVSKKGALAETAKEVSNPYAPTTGASQRQRRIGTETIASGLGEMHDVAARQRGDIQSGFDTSVGDYQSGQFSGVDELFLNLGLPSEG